MSSTSGRPLSEREGVREFAWFLDHPRLYRLIGMRWLHWRYPDVFLPDPKPAPDEAIQRGRDLARKYGW